MFNPNLVSRLPQPVSCKLLAPLLTQYVEAAASLTPGQRKAVADHLHTCSACAEETEAIQAMSGFLHERAPSMLPTPAPRADLWDRIEARIIAEERPVKQVKKVRPTLVFAPAFAAVIVAAIVAPRVMHSGAPVANTTAPAAIAAKNDFALAQREQEVAPVAALQAQVAETPNSLRAAAAQEANTVSAELRSRAKPVIVAVNKQKQPTKMAFRSRARFAGTTRQLAVTPRPLQERQDLVVFSVVPVPPAREQATADKARSARAITVADAPVINNSTAKEPNTLSDTVASVEPDSARHSAYMNFHASASLAPKVASAAPKPGMAPLTTGQITIVNSAPGNGVPESASYTTPVTETLIRSRQRRGLFGGYGAGVTAMLPANNSTKTNESGVPW